jgi:integrase/recombinase XerD
MTRLLPGNLRKAAGRRPESGMTRRLKVIGKGQKERYAFFGVGTQKALIFWKVGYRDKRATQEDTFFINTDGSPLTYRALNQMIRRLGKKTEIERLHIHLFRHTFAVNYLMNGGNLMSLRDILGHSTIEVTQIYLSMTPKHLQIQYDAYSPIDNLHLKKI